MISSRDDLRRYLAEDRRALGADGRRPRLVGDEVWCFQILLRRCEYYANCRRDPFGRIVCLWLKYRLHKATIRLGFRIPINVFGPGLAIAHTGPIGVNSGARVGAGCRIHPGVHISASGSADAVPTIGDRAYLAPGAKIFGRIVLGDDVTVGANAVVNRSCDEDGVTLAGVPAKVVARSQDRSEADDQG